jgi:Ca2+-binding RTX toxin-like protein
LPSTLRGGTFSPWGDWYTLSQRSGSSCCWGAAAAAAPTTLDQGVFVSLRAATDSTVNHIVVTYGPPKEDHSEKPMWGNYLSDTAGIHNITNPEGFACITEDATHDFCPDGTSVGEAGAGDDIVVNLRGGNDTFDASESIGQFEVKGGEGDDVLIGSDVPTKTPGYGTPPETDYNSDYLYGQGGNDHLIGNRGADFLNGGSGNDVLDGGPPGTDATGYSPKQPDDTFDGGPGNDLILAADDDRDNRIDCGPGKHDVAVIDPIDPKPIHCEKVRVKK